MDIKARLKNKTTWTDINLIFQLFKALINLSAFLFAILTKIVYNEHTGARKTVFTPLKRK